MDIYLCENIKQHQLFLILPKTLSQAIIKMEQNLAIFKNISYHINMIQVKTREKKNIANLSQEVELLRSVVIGWVGRDPEGEYNPKFVEEVFDAAVDEPICSFQSKGAFLQTLEN